MVLIRLFANLHLPQKTSADCFQIFIFVYICSHCSVIHSYCACSIGGYSRIERNGWKVLNGTSEGSSPRAPLQYSSCDVGPSCTSKIKGLQEHDNRENGDKRKKFAAEDFVSALLGLLLYFLCCKLMSNSNSQDIWMSYY